MDTQGVLCAYILAYVCVCTYYSWPLAGLSTRASLVRSEAGGDHCDATNKPESHDMIQNGVHTGGDCCSKSWLLSYPPAMKQYPMSSWHFGLPVVLCGYACIPCISRLAFFYSMIFHKTGAPWKPTSTVRVCYVHRLIQQSLMKTTMYCIVHEVPLDQCP